MIVTSFPTYCCCGEVVAVIAVGMPTYVTESSGLTEGSNVASPGYATAKELVHPEDCPIANAKPPAKSVLVAPL